MYNYIHDQAFFKRPAAPNSILCFAEVSIGSRVFSEDEHSITATRTQGSSIQYRQKQKTPTSYQPEQPSLQSQQDKKENAPNVVVVLKKEKKHSRRSRNNSERKDN